MICLSLYFSLVGNVFTNAMKLISVENTAAFIIVMLFTIY